MIRVPSNATSSTGFLITIVVGVVLAATHFALLGWFSLLGDGNAWAIKVADIMSWPGYFIRQHLQLYGTIGEFVWMLNSLLWGFSLSFVIIHMFKQRSP